MSASLGGRALIAPARPVRYWPGRERLTVPAPDLNVPALVFIGLSGVLFAAAVAATVWAVTTW